MIKAIITGTVVYFLAGYLVFDFLLGELSERHTTKLPGFRRPDGAFSMICVFVSCLAYAVLLSLVLIRWQNEQQWKMGFVKGALIGILIACMTDFYWYGTSTFYDGLFPVVLDIAAAGLTVGIMGAAIVVAGNRRAM